MQVVEWRVSGSITENEFSELYGIWVSTIHSEVCCALCVVVCVSVGVGIRAWYVLVICVRWCVGVRVGACMYVLMCGSVSVIMLVT